MLRVQINIFRLFSYKELKYKNFSILDFFIRSFSKNYCRYYFCESEKVKKKLFLREQNYAWNTTRFLKYPLTTLKRLALTLTSSIWTFAKTRLTKFHSILWWSWIISVKLNLPWTMRRWFSLKIWRRRKNTSRKIKLKPQKCPVRDKIFNFDERSNYLILKYDEFWRILISILTKD